MLNLILLGVELAAELGFGFLERIYFFIQSLQINFLPINLLVIKVQLLFINRLLFPQIIQPLMRLYILPFLVTHYFVYSLQMLLIIRSLCLHLLQLAPLIPESELEFTILVLLCSSLSL